MHSKNNEFVYILIFRFKELQVYRLISFFHLPSSVSHSSGRRFRGGRVRIRRIAMMQRSRRGIFISIPRNRLKSKRRKKRSSRYRRKSGREKEGLLQSLYSKLISRRRQQRPTCFTYMTIKPRYRINTN